MAFKELIGLGGNGSVLTRSWMGSVW